MQSTNTAVVVVDMQNAFCHPEGSLTKMGNGPILDLPKLVDDLSKMIDSARGAGIPIIYTRGTFRKGLIDADALNRARFKDHGELLVDGSWDSSIIDELAPEPEDVIVTKNRFDAFLYTDLELILRALAIRSVVVAGVLTNACVAATAMSAYMRDFDVIVPNDCTSTRDADFRDVYLRSLGSVADVRGWRSSRRW